MEENVFGKKLAAAADPTVKRRSDLEKILRQYDRDRLFSEATNRWRHGRNLVETFLPGDVMGLRQAYVSRLLHSMAASEMELESLTQGLRKATRGVSPRYDSMLVRRRYVGPHRTIHEHTRNVDHTLEVALTLSDAKPFFLPALTAVGVMRSVLPDQEQIDVLRLPFPAVTVFFSDPLRLPAELFGTPTEFGDQLMDQMMSARAEITETFAEQSWASGPEVPADIFLKGIVLLADKEQRLLNKCILLTSGPTPYQHLQQLGSELLLVTPVEFMSSRFTPVLTNMAAAVSWGDWHRPETDLELPDEFTPKEARRLLRGTKFLKAQTSGSLTDVRIIKVEPADADRRPPSVPTGRTIREHPRRGHSRNVWYGPMAERRTRVRYILATTVNPGKGDALPRAYTVPLLDESELYQNPAVETHPSGWPAPVSGPGALGIEMA